MLVLSRDVDQQCAGLGDLAQRTQRAVERGAVLAVAADHAPHHELTVGLGQAGLPEQRRHLGTGRQLEDRLDRSLLGSAPDPVCPGPRAELTLERFALSKLALSTKPIPSSAHKSRSVSPMSVLVSGSSRTHGPPIKVNGSTLPTVSGPMVHVAVMCISLAGRGERR